MAKTKSAGSTATRQTNRDIFLETLRRTGASDEVIKTAEESTSKK